MTLAPKWINHLAFGVGQAIHLMADYGQNSEPGIAGSAILTSTALALSDDPEYEVLVHNRLCCQMVKQVWRLWYDDVRQANNREVNRINKSIDIKSMLSKIGGRHDQG